MTDHPGYPPLGPGAGPDPARRASVEPEDARRGRPTRQLQCVLCGGTNFENESGSLDSDLGFTAHRVEIRICVACGYVMLFGKG